MATNYPESFMGALPANGDATLTGTETIAPVADTNSGVRTLLTVTGAADTARTTTVEQTDVYLNLARTVTWATGGITTQRFVRVAAPTMAFVGASTVTTAVTFDIGGAPVAGTNATITNSYAFRVASGASYFAGATTVAAAASVAPTAASSGTRTALTVTGAADTGVTTTAEQVDVNLNLARTVTWATGAITTQRAMRVQAPTYAFAGASTITTAVTLDIDNAPQAGANATLTNAYALRVVAGATYLGGSVGIGGAPDARAALTVTSTTQGFLPPRMTSTQRDAIASPTAGLVIYNSTTNKLNFYSGSAWEAVTSA